MIFQCTTEEDYRKLLAASGDRPVFLLKHSTTCGISALARSEYESFAGNTGTGDFWLLTVQSSRDISDLIARETGVRHESPQAFLFSGGEVVWTASHGHIEQETMRTALEALTP